VWSRAFRGDRAEGGHSRDSAAGGDWIRRQADRAVDRIVRPRASDDAAEYRAWLWAIIFRADRLEHRRRAAICRRGVETYEFWLKVGIVLLGVRFLLGDVVKLGGVSLLCVALELAVAIVIMTALGRAFGLPPKLISLLAIGSSICGVSAIIAAKGAIDADDEDASYAIAAILALGAVSLFVFPVIGRAFGMTDHAYGLWVGLAVDNTAEATAAGALYSDAAGKFAVLAKTARNATIGFVVLGYALYWARRQQSGGIGRKGAFLWTKFPKFVIGFLVISALATAGAFTAAQVTSIANLSRWAFLLTFAGVGLRTNVRELAQQGWRPLIVGVVGECAIAAVTLVMVIAASRAFAL
jgi:uncharacterized integral membrane protein (TIGR00698 family)